MTRLATCHSDRKAFGRGLCSACYQRARRNGFAEPSAPPLRVVPVDADDYIDPDAPHCDICAAHDVKLVRFSLIHAIRDKAGHRTSRGAGAITLCGSCWAKCRKTARRYSRWANRPRKAA